MTIDVRRLDGTLRLLQENVAQVAREFRDFRDALRIDIRELKAAQLGDIRELRLGIRLMWAGFFGLGVVMARGFHWS